MIEHMVVMTNINTNQGSDVKGLVKFGSWDPTAIENNTDLTII